MPLKTVAIKQFLELKTHPDLAALYSPNMECQVNAARDGGDQYEGEYKGRTWRGWTDGSTVWKSFRIPFNAATKATYEDTDLRWDLLQHAEAVGMTGWDWKHCVSRWVAYDFDSILNHKQGLTGEQLKEILRTTERVPWVTTRHSTSGKGVHIYVMLHPVPTKNHTEHAALSRAILGKLQAETGLDLLNSVDICGSNMWVWHRKMQGRGLVISKKGEWLHDVPPNWRDHLSVISGRRHKTLPQQINESGSTTTDLFETLTAQSVRVPLDSEHKKLIQWLKDEGAVWWWDNDRHMLVTHTKYLEKAHDELSMKGVFQTTTTATSEHNCFLFPMRLGAWSVRRFSPGCSEHETWDQDAGGWTFCYLNKEPNLKTAARAHGGVEMAAGGFQFQEAELAVRAAQELGASVEIPTVMSKREAVLKEHKDGRLLVSLKHETTDGRALEQWAVKGSQWQRLYNIKHSAGKDEVEFAGPEDVIRHVIAAEKDAGWFVKGSGWQQEPITNTKLFMKAQGYSVKEIDLLMGACIMQPWVMVNKPFQAEYPGGREWNRNAAQFKVIPNPNLESVVHPTWDSLLHRIGEGLDSAIQQDQWCKMNGIYCGADYLRIWLASVVQYPLRPLPYLFLYSPEQKTGKTTFHEALDLLIMNGIQRADTALTDQRGFNAELKHAVVCYVEEVSLKKSPVAYSRIKDWVTSRKMSVHEKGGTPYSVDNSTHWIQCANDPQACPVFAGDTRITVIRVPPLDPLDMIPSVRFFEMLEREASDFLATLLATEIPESPDRLNMPVISSSEKIALEESNKSLLDVFCDDHVHKHDGALLPYADFYSAFHKWIPDEERATGYWTKSRVSIELGTRFVKGKHNNNITMIGNISLEPIEEPETEKWVLNNGGHLIREHKAHS